MSPGRARVCTFLQDIYRISLTNEGERKVPLSNWEKRDRQTLKCACKRVLPVKMERKGKSCWAGDRGMRGDKCARTVRGHVPTHGSETGS